MSGLEQSMVRFGIGRERSSNILQDSTSHHGRQNQFPSSINEKAKGESRNIL
jgi:hypothetical protein